MKQFQKLNTDIKDKIQTAEVCMYPFRKIFKFVKKLIEMQSKNKIDTNPKDLEEPTK